MVYTNQKEGDFGDGLFLFYTHAAVSGAEEFTTF